MRSYGGRGGYGGSGGSASPSAKADISSRGGSGSNRGRRGGTAKKGDGKAWRGGSWKGGGIIRGSSTPLSGRRPGSGLKTAQSPKVIPRLAPLKSVGVIGGGISGLSFAFHLEQLCPSSRMSVAVYDTGKRGVGGRCSSRTGLGKQGSWVSDHAAQCVFSSTEEFSKQLEAWAHQGVVRQWNAAKIGTVAIDSAFKQPQERLGKREKAPPKRRLYIGSGTKGIGSIPHHLASQLRGRVMTGAWVSPSGGLRYDPNRETLKWGVFVNGREVGRHDAIVIAHNGKCAHRITSKVPGPVHSLLGTRFAPSLERPGDRGGRVGQAGTGGAGGGRGKRGGGGGGRQLILNSVYSLTIWLPKGVLNLRGVEGQHLDAATVVGSEVLSWLACNSCKYPFEQQQQQQQHATKKGKKGRGEAGAGELVGAGGQCWTLLSRAEFGTKYKVPQENIDEKTERLVCGLMLGEAMRLCRQAADGETGKKATPYATGAEASEGKEGERPDSGSNPGGQVDPLSLLTGRKLQLWGAGLPLNTWVSSDKALSLWDQQQQVGVVGDWLCSPSIEGAWRSGRDLAQRLAMPLCVRNGGEGSGHDPQPPLMPPPSHGLKGHFAANANSTDFSADLGV